MWFLGGSSDKTPDMIGKRNKMGGHSVQVVKFGGGCMVRGQPIGVQIPTSPETGWTPSQRRSGPDVYVCPLSECFHHSVWSSYITVPSTSSGVVLLYVFRASWYQPLNRICDYNMCIISGAVLCDGCSVIGCSLLPKSRQESTKKNVQGRISSRTHIRAFWSRLIYNGQDVRP